MIEHLKWALSIIRKFQDERIYGEVVVKFEAGKIVHVQEKTNRKPPKENQ